MTALPNPFIDSTLDPETGVGTAAGPDTDPPVPAAEFPRGFDPDRFAAEIDPLPLFLTSPTRDFLIGCGLEPVLEILDAH
jgi:hypothetical protein